MLQWVRHFWTPLSSMSFVVPPFSLVSSKSRNRIQSDIGCHRENACCQLAACGLNETNLLRSDGNTCSAIESSSKKWSLDACHVQPFCSGYPVTPRWDLTWWEGRDGWGVVCGSTCFVEYLCLENELLSGASFWVILSKLKIVIWTNKRLRFPRSLRMTPYKLNLWRLCFLWRSDLDLYEKKSQTTLLNV